MKSLIIAACRTIGNVVPEPHRFAPMLYQTVLKYENGTTDTHTWLQFRNRIKYV